MGIWFGTTESKGPYGYVCTGLLYSKDGDNMFALNKLVLVIVDMTLKECIEMPLYTDRFEYSPDEIIEKDGAHYCKSFMGDDIPILNYDKLNIPQRLECKTGIPVGTGNRIARSEVDVWGEKYRELYAFLLDFDKDTMTGEVLGFDGLGKIFRQRMNPTEGTDSDDRLISIRASYINSYMNLSYYKDENGEIVCEYTPIWTQ